MGSSNGGNGVLHAPQRPVSARWLAAMRFFLPQALQVLITGISSSPVGWIHLASFGCICFVAEVNRCVKLRRFAESCSVGRKPPAGAGAPATVILFIVSMQ